MTFNYTLSWVMKNGHKIASAIREKCNTYREALSLGLRKAWKTAKLSMAFNECAKVVHEDVQQEWAQSCLGNVEVEVCAFEVARG